MRIDEIHEYLDRIEEVIEKLNDIQSEEISAEEISDLILIVGDLHGWGTAYTDGGPKLGIAAPVLSRYVKQTRSSYLTHEARVVAQRVRSFLRSQDQATNLNGHQDARPPSEAATSHTDDPASPLTIKGEGWHIVGQATDLKVKILALSMLVESIMERVRGSNSPPNQQALTQLERSQLITILETALSVLKAPMVEVGLLKKLKKALSGVARKAAEKQVEEGLGSLADLAASELTDVISQIGS
jgi:hypothetical protein